MKKYILFAATKLNCGMICRNCGEWLNTKYVIYSDGTCWRVSKYDDDRKRRSILAQLLPKQAYLKIDQPKTFRIDEIKFDRLKALLETQFDGVEGDWGCDGTQWEMYHYAPSGKLLHSPGRCFAEHIPVLKEIKEILEQR